MEAIPPDPIFISYAHDHDDLEVVKRLEQTLDQAGLDVWFDQSTLKGGDDWEHRIKATIRKCSLFLAVISVNAVQRVEGYFRREWRWAVERAQGIAESIPFIVPVIVDDTPEGAEHVPEDFWKKQSLRAVGGVLAPERVDQLRAKVRQVRSSRGRSG